MHSTTIHDLLELRQFATTLLAQYETSSQLLLALHGELGAGKTAFVQALATVLGVTEPVTSPTFTILSRYHTTHPTWQTLLHMDAYRITSETELGPLYFTELCTEPQTIFCIEWASLIAAALPSHTLHITLVIASDETREVRLQSHEEWLATR